MKRTRDVSKVNYAAPKKCIPLVMLQLMPSAEMGLF